MSSEYETDGPWERVASELRACRDAQQRTWDDVDNALLGRYLADDVTPEERRLIETALAERPELRKLTDLVSDVLGDGASASAPGIASGSATLPFRKPRTTRWRQRAAVAAAAGLLFILGYTVLPGTGPSPSAPSEAAYATRPDRNMGLRVAVAFHPPLPADASADGSPAERAEWEGLKKRILGAERPVGVHDGLELFSPLALKEGRRAVRELARDYSVQVFAETKGAFDNNAAGQGTKDRAHAVEPNGVSFVIRRSPVRVDIYVGRSLRDQGFDQQRQNQLRKIVEADVGRRDYDQGLLDGVRFVAHFEAERAKETKP